MSLAATGVRSPATKVPYRTEPQERRCRDILPPETKHLNPPFVGLDPPSFPIQAKSRRLLWRHRLPVRPSRSSCKHPPHPRRPGAPPGPRSRTRVEDAVDVVFNGLQAPGRSSQQQASSSQGTRGVRGRRSRYRYLDFLLSFLRYPLRDRRFRAKAWGKWSQWERELLASYRLARHRARLPTGFYCLLLYTVLAYDVYKGVIWGRGRGRQ